jgi:DNA-binding HxlR family transcriptional regulator
VDAGLLSRRDDPTHNQKAIYSLTEPAIQLVPLLAPKQEGMHFLRESALDRVRRGLTTLREIDKVTFIEAFR